MRTIRYILPLLVVLFDMAVVTAQQLSPLRFDTLQHDFGTISESGGEVSCSFRCRNITDTPIVIVSASTSCGCTKAEFSRKPIMPDSVAEIKVRFNPLNYPGTFARKVMITTDKGVVAERLLVRGQVTPRELTIEEIYPLNMGLGVRAAANSHSFGYVEHGKPIQSVFEIRNTSSRTVSLQIENPHSELEFYYPTMLAPNESATLNFECHLAENSQVYGTLAYKVNLLIDSKQAKYPFIINGIAIDLREEIADNSAPRIAVSEKFIKFGAVNSAKGSLRSSVVLTNSGEKPLMVRRLESSSGKLKARLVGSDTIGAGESREVVVEMNPSQLGYGAVVDKLLIISTDPKSPVVTLRVSAIVER